MKKTCPFRKVLSLTYPDQPETSPAEESFLPCVGEACMLWEQPLVFDSTKGEAVAAGDGFCRLASRP